MAHVYRALYRLPISINLLRFSCGYTSQNAPAPTPGRSRTTPRICTIVLIWQEWQVRSKSKNEAKSLLRGHCPLCTTQRFIGALVPSIFGPHVVQARASPPPSWGSAPQPRSSDDDVPAQLPTQFTSYCAYLNKSYVSQITYLREIDINCWKIQ